MVIDLGWGRSKKSVASVKRRLLTSEEEEAHLSLSSPKCLQVPSDDE